MLGRGKTPCPSCGRRCHTLAVYLCYVDDSGDSRNGTTLSAVLVRAEHWSDLLDAWLEGRREIHRLFGVGKHAELHANQLYKGRGRYCESAEQEARFGTPQRAATGRIMLSHLARFSDFHVVTIGSPLTATPTVYAQFVARLEDWAVGEDTHRMVFYDGHRVCTTQVSSPRLTSWTSCGRPLCGMPRRTGERTETLTWAHVASSKTSSCRTARTAS